MKTRFNIGDIVIKIARYNVKTWVPCGFCQSSGNIQGGDGTYRDCPECYNKRGKYTYAPEAAWHLCDHNPVLTIGAITVKIEPRKQIETYMAKETGVIIEGKAGCASNHPGKDLFANNDEAKTECSIRNSATQPQQTEKGS